MTSTKLTIIGISGAIAVALGALGAHFLKAKVVLGIISPDQLNGFDTAVKYHIYHTMMMLFVFILSKSNSHKFLNWAYTCFFIGILTFSGSLYFLCTRNLFNADWLKVLGPITPIGGLFFIAGWLLLAMLGFKGSTAKIESN